MDLDEIGSQLRSVFGANVTVDRADDTLLISFRSWEAEVGVTIADPDRPSFNVTYPALRGQSSTIRDAQEESATGVLFEGLSWIVRELVTYGVVLPEFHPLRQAEPPFSRLWAARRE